MGDVAWHQTHIALARRSTGRWTVNVDRPGRYRFSLRRWPAELGLPLGERIPPEEARTLIYNDGTGTCNAVTPSRARLKIFDREHTVPVSAAETEAVFDIEIGHRGVSCLDAWFADENGEEQGAYYVYVERV
jgi:hypothetical protein